MHAAGLRNELPSSPRSSLFRRSALFEIARLFVCREHRPVAVALALCFAFLFWKATQMRYPDLAFRYPFVMSDSYQWMVDGLLYRGRDVDASYRNPGLPLLLAALGAFGAERDLPLATTVLSGAFFGYLALTLLRRFAALPVALTLLVLSFTFSLQTSFDFVLADPWAVTLQLIAVHHLLRAREEPTALVPAALFAAASLLFQYAIAWLSPAFAIYYLAVLRRTSPDRRRLDRKAGVAVAAAVAMLLPLLVYRTIRFGNPLHTRLDYFALLSPHLFGVPFYAFNFLAFVGIPAGALVAAGGMASLREGGTLALVNLCLLCYFLFWILLYQWLDPRFLLYFVPFVAFHLARAFESMHVRGWFRVRTAPLRGLAGWTIVTLALLYAAYDRGHPFARNVLPITPRAALVAATRQVTRFGGNVDIVLGSARVAKTPHRFPALSFIARYYPDHRRGADSPPDPETSDLERLRLAAGGERRVAGCGDLPQSYFSAMKRELAIGSRLLPCEAAVELALYPAADTTVRNELVFAGSFYRLVRRPIR